MPPIHLPGNQPADRFYQGGSKIRSFRPAQGVPSAGERVPEDWVGSTTTIFNEVPVGLTTLPDGRALKVAVENDPLHWLGQRHVSKYGADTKLLVKLLDAGQRLPVHIHPDGSFAAEHLNHAHGKAEAWYILEGGTVFLGFKREIDTDELEGWVQAQNIEAMMAVMHEISVLPGDSVYVPPGLPHAIGAGIFLVEVQEPEDLSILLEWQGFAIDGPANGHLGLGFKTALLATDRNARSKEWIESLIVRQGTGPSTLAVGCEEFFRAEHFELTENLVLDAGFSILVVTEGRGTLSTADGDRTLLAKGDTVLVSHNDGELHLTGQVSVVRCRPPV